MRIQSRLDPSECRPSIALALRIMLVALASGWLCVSGAIAEVSEPAGFVRLVVPGESALMVSMPFNPYDDSLDGVFSNQLQGAADETDADRILHWDRAAQEYRGSFKAENTGNPSRDGFWFESGTNWIPSAQTVEPGLGFWIENRQSEQQVFLCGALLLNAVCSEDFLYGLNMFGYPYPASVPLAWTELAADGAHGGTNISEADWLICPETQTTNWLFKSAGHVWHDQWLNSTGAISDAVFQQGHGYWYQRSPTNGFTWSVPRPYAADIFSGGSNTPSIVSVIPSAGLDAMAIGIACSGQDGEVLEVFYQDIEPGASFDSAGPWLVADEDIGALAQSNLVWHDAGDVQRLSVTAVFSRVYVVSRQDADADGDGLSDGREGLVYGTDPELFDTDGDGLSDAEELAIGTAPLLYDTDDDGMGDGAEVRWGFCPTSSAAYASLPWVDDFESLLVGAVHEQNQWFADPVDAVQVQTGLVKNGLQALEFTSESGGAVLQHHYGAAGTDPIWVDMWLRSVPGSLPDMTSASDDRSAVVAVNEEGFLCGWDGVASQWIALTNLPSVGGQWIRLTLALDYETRNWSLYVDGLLGIADLGFADNTLREFSRAQWQGSSGLPSSYLDDVSVTGTEPQHLDDDQDGMPNYWERLYGLDVDSDDTAEDPDGDGLTNQEEYALGTNPILADTDNDGLTDGEELSWGYNPLAGNSFHNLPWSCDFEPGEGYEEGSLSGQQGWIVPQGSAVVQSNVAFSGTLAAALQSNEPGQSTLVQNIALGSTGQVVWTDLRMRMIPEPVPETSPHVRHATALIRLDGDFALAGFDGISGGWVSATNSPPTKFLSWVHLTVKRDYNAKTWALYHNGVPVLENLGFADPSAERPSLFRVEGGGTGEMLDAISITDEMPAHVDDDNDGIPNALEPGYETDPFDPDTDNDGMDDGRELDWIFDPLVSNDFARLPWTANFESAEGYQTGLLAGQQRWLADSSVFVQNAAVFSGNQAVELQPVEGQGAHMTQYFGAQGEPIVWFETYVRLRSGALPDPGSFPSTHAALFAVNVEGLPCAYDSGRGEWSVSSLAHRVLPEDWSRLVFRLDYRHREWCLYVDGVRVFHNVPFLHPTTRTLSRVLITVPDASPLTPSVFVDAMAVLTVEPDLLDNDGDGMPNAWEILHGFDPENPFDRWGDLDGDGLINAEEFAHGTDPMNSDTDGDGMSDGLEVRVFHTNPLNMEFTGERETIASLSGSSADIIAGSWQATATGSLRARTRNGVLQYTFGITNPGMYAIAFEVEQYNALTLQDTFDLALEVNDRFAGRQTICAPHGDSAEALFLTPFLDAGDNVFTLHWQNFRANTFLAVHRVLLLRLGGLTNEFGEIEWVVSRRENAIRVDLPPDSPVSPLCVEGESAFRDSLMVKSSASDPEAEFPARFGPDARWFVDVPLDSDGLDTEVIVSEDYIGSALTQRVAWTETNLLPAPTNTLTIRRGDALRLMARPDGASNGQVSIDIVGVTNYVTTVASPMPHWFTESGDYCVIASWSHEGQVQGATAEVHVIHAEFSGNPICILGQVRSWLCPQLPADVFLDHDQWLWVKPQAAAGGGQVLSLATQNSVTRYLLARLQKDGPILDQAEVYGVNGDNGSYWSIVATFPDGSRLVEVQLALGSVPSDLRVELEIFVGGVLFENGTRYLTLTADDFDERGVAVYRFIQAPDSMTSVCHTTSFYDGDTLIGGN